MNRYEDISNKLSKGEFTSIKTSYRESAERIIKRAIVKGWWFSVWQIEGEWHIAFSSNIDLEIDLKSKLSNLKFELD